MKENDGFPQWLSWAREIQALAQSGKHYALNDFQSERYDRLAEIAAEMLAGSVNIEADDLAVEFQQQTGYATPRVDVRAAVFDDAGQILLVQDWRDKTWSMPGGWADVGDVPSEAAERETLEESGLVVRALRVLGVYDANRVPGKLDIYHAYKLIYFCAYQGGELRTSNETLAVRFFSANDLPTALGSRTSRLQLDHAFQVLAKPEIPAFFD